MTDILGDIFGVEKPLIAMCHLHGLPGRPRHDVRGGSNAIVEALSRDVAALQEAGVDGLLFCNEQDIPYQLKVGPEVVAAMSAVVGRVLAEVSTPYGVNVLFDPMATLAVGRAVGARFVREVFTGVFDSDMGLVNPSFGDLMGYRQAIGGSDMAVFTNITPEFSRSIGQRTVAERAKGAAFLGADAILISGPMAGVPYGMSDLREAREAVTDKPILANTGVNAGNVGQALEIADGVIVGTSLKVDGYIWNPVDPERARKLVSAIRDARAAGVR
jgi:membrane complex biogenesis BtpA family protein